MAYFPSGAPMSSRDCCSIGQRRRASATKSTSGVVAARCSRSYFRSSVAARSHSSQRSPRPRHTVGKAEAFAPGAERGVGAVVRVDHDPGVRQGHDRGGVPQHRYHPPDGRTRDPAPTPKTTDVVRTRCLALPRYVLRRDLPATPTVSPPRDVSCEFSEIAIEAFSLANTGTASSPC